MFGRYPPKSRFFFLLLLFIGLFVRDIHYTKQAVFAEGTQRLTLTVTKDILLRTLHSISLKTFQNCLYISTLAAWYIILQQRLEQASQFRKFPRNARRKPMDSRDGQSYMDLRRQNSMRRYTYEGYGGQKHDNTLILHKSENCSNDTIVLRLCKRLGGRISWSSCVKGKLLLATVLALMAIFCYLNLFSAYLPKTCHVFAIRSSRKLRSLQDSENEPAVFVRTEKTFSEINFEFNPELSRRKRGEEFSTFTRQVILNMK